MSGRVRLVLASVVATLGAGSALVPLVDRAGWILQAAFLLAVQSGVGLLVRRAVRARPLAVAAQALTGLVLLTAVFAGGRAVGGLLPGPDAFREFALLLREGTEDVGRYAIPAPATEGIRLLLVGGVLVVGLAVDTLAVTYRSAAPAGLPLLALYSIAAGLARGGADWLWFLVAAAGYLLLLLAEGRDRPARWGRVLGASGAGPGVAPEPAPPPSSPVRTGRRIGVLALGFALAVPAALPAMGDGLLLPRGPDGGPAGGLGSGAFSAVRPLVALRDALNQPENRELLRYRGAPDGARDLYLRIVALDRFDGTAWRASERAVTEVPEVLPAPAGLSSGVRTEPVTTTVTASGTYAQNYLPLPYPALEVRSGGRWRFEPEGRVLVGEGGQSTRGLRYEVLSLRVSPTAAQLAGAPAPKEEVLREYTRVPPALPRAVAETARSVTAGSANPYQQAVRLQEWFAVDGGFRYDTSVDSGSGSAAIAKFLQDKQGFCVHFSFAMAAMARTLGIPARVAVGFTPGTPLADGSMSVGTKDAHAWPELYFEGVGWTRFEPTPSRGTAPAYTVADAPAREGAGAPVPTPGRSQAPAAAPSAPAGCPQDGTGAEGCAHSLRLRVGDGQSAGGPSPVLLAAGVLAGLAVLALPLLPLLWRRRVRARRLGGPGRHAEGGGDGSPAPQAVVERTLAAWHEMTDSAWDYGIPPDASLTPRGTAARIVRAGGLAGAAAESAHRVATAVEQALYAPRPRAATGLPADVERVRTALRGAASRGVRLRAAVAPRSAARLLRARPRRRPADR
ncbi:DUF3488 and DUF4129 domain-containing transglutaminase family protein [Streptomyces gamaensis]|uniref:DUF3488 and DUF4129 domain-containing transglutaminase family protein n=1 Tax=Streptomyces gamaensis TaxID=1763542 RepID=A0ABW0Z2T9_9ACTN